MHPIPLRQKVFSLRKAGYSYSYIAKRTGISKATLSDWLSRVPYTPNSETIRAVGKAVAASNARKTQIKQQNIRDIKERAFREVGRITKRDLFMFGLGLYLGEGSKGHDITRITNSDPDVIRLAIAWFHSLGVSGEQFFLTVHLYPDSKVDSSLQFWSRETTIPLSQFGKVQIDRRTNKRKYKRGKLPHGTAHLTVRSLGRKEFGVALSRKILASIEAVVQETKAGLV